MRFNRFNEVRPSRLDFFPSPKSLELWLEEHRLPVDRTKTGLERNILTMLKATGSGW